MINMFSVSKFDPAVKGNAPMDDKPDADVSNDLFASLLTGALFAPAPVTPSKADETSVFITNAGFSTDPVSSVDTEKFEGLHQNPLGLGEEPPDDRDPVFFGSIEKPAPIKQPLLIRPPVGIVPQINSIDEDSKAVMDQNRRGASAEGISMPEIFDSLEPVKPDGLIAPVPNQPIVQPRQSGPVDGQKTSKTSLPDLPDIKIQIHRPGTESVFQKDTAASRAAVSIVLQPDNPAVLSGLTRAYREISNSTPTDISREIAAASDVSAKAAPGSPVSNQTSRSATVTQSSELPRQQTIVDRVFQAGQDHSGGALAQGPKELLIPEKDIKQPNRMDEAAFASSLGAAVNLQKTADVAVSEKLINRQVLDQIEPRVLDLITEIRGGDEKRILKMRLTPAELGTVEVTIEKGAGGQVSTHFQTESQQTRQILSESISTLRESLERSGIHVGDMDVSCSSFSSAGSDDRRDRPQKFGSAESNSAGPINFDGTLTTEDDGSDRLVSLRA